MTNYREILRLDNLGLNKTQIAAACGCSRTTVIQTLLLAKKKKLQYPLPDSLSDKQLADMLFPTATGKPTFKMPDYEYVYRELQKNGVTLNLLWLEYCDACRSGGEIPYQSTQFNKYYNLLRRLRSSWDSLIFARPCHGCKRNLPCSLISRFLSA